MSIQTEIDRISTNVDGSLSALSDLGVAVAATATSDDLPGLIAAIPTVSIPVPIESGGTGATTAEGARASLGLGLGLTLDEHSGYSISKNSFGIVTVQLHKSFSSLAQWGAVSVCTLPEGCRPPFQLVEVGYQYTSTGTVAVSFRVNTDGYVEAVPYSAGGSGTMNACFTFAAAN